MQSSSLQPSILKAACRYWTDAAAHTSRLAATQDLLAAVWDFLRNSTPARLRQRYGDADYDWDHRVNTTSAAVGWRDRLLGVFHSPYQPTEPALFHEMLDGLHETRNTDSQTDRACLPLDFREYTLVDLGSGKGRTLLMASDYPFRRILGVEILPALHQIAQQNLRQYKNESQKCFALEAICADATSFPIPDGPLLIYLFNPFPETGLRRVVANLEQSLRANPQTMYLLYHNPVLDHVLSRSGVFHKVSGTHQYSIWRSA
jgi:hypothetical protein